MTHEVVFHWRANEKFWTLNKDIRAVLQAQKSFLIIFDTQNTMLERTADSRLLKGEQKGKKNTWDIRDVNIETFVDTLDTLQCFGYRISG
jgi:hypothetical protein